MHTRFTITIHDLNGLKQYSLHQIMKKVMLYAAGGILALIVGGAALIIFLNNSLDEIIQKKSELERSIVTAENRLASKQEELTAVSDRLDDIENLMGLHQENIATDSLLKRVEIAKLTSAQRAALLQYIPNGSPVPYNGITSKFGYRQHPTLHRREFHRGSDLRAPVNTELRATANGVIEYAGFHKASGYGRLIIIDHNYGFKTYFGHLKKIAVKPGQYVKKGEVIGYTGNSGMSNGPHLHYEVRFIQRALNPYWFIKWDMKTYMSIFEKEKKVPWQSLVAAITRDQNLQKSLSSTAERPLLRTARSSQVK